MTQYRLHREIPGYICPNNELKKCMLWRQTVQIMSKIGSLAKFPAGLAGGETPKAQPPRPSKPFIPRRIFA
jgi:hypothetical protein